MGLYFMWSCHMVFYNDCTHLYSFTSARIPFLWVFSNICFFFFCFDDSHSNWSKILSHCICSAFPCWLMVLIIFNTPFAHVFAFFPYRLFAHLTCLLTEWRSSKYVKCRFLYFIPVSGRHWIVSTCICLVTYFSSHIWKSDSHNIQFHNMSVIRLCNIHCILVSVNNPSSTQ